MVRHLSPRMKKSSESDKTFEKYYKWLQVGLVGDYRRFQPDVVRVGVPKVSQNEKVGRRRRG